MSKRHIEIIGKDSNVSMSKKEELSEWLTIILGMLAVAAGVALAIAILKADVGALFVH